MKTCYQCAEAAQDAAKVCPHCRYKFSWIDDLPPASKEVLEVNERLFVKSTAVGCLVILAVVVIGLIANWPN